MADIRPISITVDFSRLLLLTGSGVDLLTQRLEAIRKTVHPHTI
jgi:hypothetical protein